MPQSEWVKDPAAVLDYVFDWKPLTHSTGLSDWLGALETITARTVTVDAGLTLVSSAITDAGTTVTVWLSGGTAGIEYKVACRITTSGLRRDERTIKIKVEQR